MIPLGILAAAGRGTVAPPTATTWDSGAKGSEIVLTNGNMDAENPVGAWRSVYGTKGRSNGKFAYEIVFLAGAADKRPFASLADKTNLSNVLGTYTGNNSFTTKESIGYWGHAYIYYNLTPGVSYVVAPQTAVNDIVTVAVDIDALEVSFYRNGTHVYTLAIPPGKIWFPASSLIGGGKVRLRASGLVHLPSGFNEWG